MQFESQTLKLHNWKIKMRFFLCVAESKIIIHLFGARCYRLTSRATRKKNTWNETNTDIGTARISTIQRIWIFGTYLLHENSADRVLPTDDGMITFRLNAEHFQREKRAEKNTDYGDILRVQQFFWTEKNVYLVGCTPSECFIMFGQLFPPFLLLGIIAAMR